MGVRERESCATESTKCERDRWWVTERTSLGGREWTQGRENEIHEIRTVAVKGKSKKVRRTISVLNWLLKYVAGCIFLELKFPRGFVWNGNDIEVLFLLNKKRNVIVCEYKCLYQYQKSYALRVSLEFWFLGFMRLELEILSWLRVFLVWILV